MSLLPTNVRRRSVRHRGANAVAAILALGVIALGALSAAQPAHAADFAITTPDDLLFPGTVTIAGTKDLTSTVRIPSVTGGDAHCIEPASGEAPREEWTCSFPLPDGQYSLRVLEYSDDSPQTVTEATITVRVLGEPVITGPALTNGLLTGTGYPGAGIALSGDTGACTTVLSNGFWSCPLAEPSGAYSLVATQTWEGDADQEGGSSAPFRVTVDKDPPALPSFTTPTPGERVTGRPITFAGGNGEDAARVDVFIDGTLACGDAVSAGSWACAAALDDGEHRVQAIQWDPAGNPSGSTTPFAITVGAAASAPPAPQPAPPGAPANPSQPGTPEVPTEPETPPAPTPSPGATASPSPRPGLPFFPPPIGGQSGLPPLDTWDTPTDYGAAIPSVAAATTPGSLLLALVVAVAFLVFVGLPLRLMAGALGMRSPRRPDAAETAAAPGTAEPLLAPTVTAALAFGAAILLAALAGGIQGEARYLRLLLGIAIAVVVLGGVGALTAKLGGWIVREAVGLRLVPLFLGIATVSALASRIGGIQPPIIVGVLLGVTFAVQTGTRQRGVVALMQLIAPALLGLGAWIGHSAIGAVEGLGPSLASETLAALCLAGLGSAVALALPVGRLPGRAVFDWSPLAWVGFALPASTAAAAVIASAATFPLPWVIGAWLTFAAVGTATWAWVTLVEPAFVTRGRESR